jgi:hypothetical protein
MYPQNAKGTTENREIIERHTLKRRAKKPIIAWQQGTSLFADAF